MDYARLTSLTEIVDVCSSKDIKMIFESQRKGLLQTDVVER